MRSIFRHFFLFSFTAFLSLLFYGCSNDPAQPTEQNNPLEGTWQQNYYYKASPLNGEVSYAGNSAASADSVPASTEIKFAGSSVTIKILPIRMNHSLISPENEKYIMDTLLTGTCRWVNDTLIITCTGFSNQENFRIKADKPETKKYIVSLDGGSMRVSPVRDNADPFVCTFNDFLWGYSWGRKSGQFIKLTNQ
jgi:hypothetical protein